jgi:hypothetical protein
MNKVFLITRGIYGNGVKAVIKEHGKKNILYETWEVDEDLPPIIDEDDISLPDFTGCDLILSYALHPDINLFIIDALKCSEKVLLMPHGNAPLPPGYHAYGQFLVGVLKPCCVIPPFDNDILSVFREEFGTPSFFIETDGNLITRCEVQVHTRCGAADFIAENIVGVSLEKVYQKAGLYAQYHCQSSLGPLGAIHDAGKIHADAVKKALHRKKERNRTKKK